MNQSLMELDNHIMHSYSDQLVCQNKITCI